MAIIKPQFLRPPAGTALNPTHRLNKGLVGYWPLGDGQGTVARDVSTRKRNGTLTNMAMTPSSGWGRGKFGSAPNFDGTDDYINTPAADADFLGDISISVWARLQTDHSKEHAFANKHASNGSTANPFDFRTSGTITPTLGLVRANTDYRHWTSAANISSSLDRWQHYVVLSRADMSDLPEFWIGGVTGQTNLDYSGGTGTPTGTTEPIRIGARGSYSAATLGKMAEMRIYNRILSRAEIRELYTDPFCMYQRDMVHLGTSSAELYSALVATDGTAIRSMVSGATFKVRLG